MEGKEGKIFAINLVDNGKGKIKSYRIKMTSPNKDVSLACAVLIDQVSARSGYSRLYLIWLTLYKLIRININARKSIIKSWFDRRDAMKMSLQTEKNNDKLKKNHENFRSN